MSQSTGTSQSDNREEVNILKKSKEVENISGKDPDEFTLSGSDYAASGDEKVDDFEKEAQGFVSNNTKIRENHAQFGQSQHETEKGFVDANKENNKMLSNENNDTLKSSKIEDEMNNEKKKTHDPDYVGRFFGEQRHPKKEQYNRVVDEESTFDPEPNLTEEEEKLNKIAKDSQSYNEKEFDDNSFNFESNGIEEEQNKNLKESAKESAKEVDGSTFDFGSKTSNDGASKNSKKVDESSFDFESDFVEEEQNKTLKSEEEQKQKKDSKHESASTFNPKAESTFDLGSSLDEEELSKDPNDGAVKFAKFEDKNKSDYEFDYESDVESKLNKGTSTSNPNIDVNTEKISKDMSKDSKADEESEFNTAHITLATADKKSLLHFNEESADEKIDFVDDEGIEYKSKNINDDESKLTKYDDPLFKKKDSARNSPENDDESFDLGEPQNDLFIVNKPVTKDKRLLEPPIKHSLQLLNEFRRILSAFKLPNDVNDRQCTESLKRSIVFLSSIARNIELMLNLGVILEAEKSFANLIELIRTHREAISVCSVGNIFVSWEKDINSKYDLFGRQNQIGNFEIAGRLEILFAKLRNFGDQNRK